MSDERDPIIDSLLDEVLGGEQPPDLTQRILGAHRAMVEVDDDAVAVKSRSRVVRRDIKLGRRKRLSIPAGWGAVAVVLVGAAVFVVGAWKQSEYYNQANQAPSADATQLNSPSDSIVSVEPPGDYDGQEDEVVVPDWVNPQVVLDQIEKGHLSDSSVSPLRFADDALDTPEFNRLTRLGAAPADVEVVSFIDSQLKAAWRQSRVTPTRGVGDLVWLNRAAFALLGRNANSIERAAFAESRDREEAVDRLLGHEDFVQHWGNLLANVLLGGATSDRFDRASLEAYLSQSLRDDKSFDELAFELITAQGAVGGVAESNPAANFLLAHHSGAGVPVSATDKVCQVFLGKQMQCVRCHDHYANSSLVQETYWGLASFFAQMRVEKTVGGGVALVDRDYAGTNGKSLDEADLFFTDSNDVGRVAYPLFPGQASSLSKSGRISEVNRRVELANFIVGSDDFAEAAVNRMWRLVFRSGFTQPVDDMGEHNLPEAPQAELLRGLAVEFRNSEFDIRSALRWMLRSAAFDRRVRGKSDPLVLLVGRDAFSSFPPLQPSGHPAIGKDLALAAANLSRNPAMSLGNLGAGKSVSSGSAAKDRREVNSLHRQQLLSVSPGSLLTRLAGNRSLKASDSVAHLFYSFLGRSPTDAELKSGVAVLNSAPRKQGLVEIGKILMDSNEFRTQH